MATFYDDFQRANGAIGNGWVVTNSSPTIVGGNVTANGSWSIQHPSISDSEYLEAETHQFHHPTQADNAGPMVKVAPGGYAGFVCGFFSAGAQPNFQLRAGSITTSTLLAEVAISAPVPPYYSLRIVWDLGHISAYYQGELLLEYDSGQYAANELTGCAGYLTYSPTADFRAIGSSALGLSVDPNVIPNYGECSELALTGTNTEWVAGTPGSPIFTVNHGTISAQTVVDETSATITYCPGDYLGAVVFTDPSTGETAGAIVTSDPTILNPGGLALSAEAIAYIERSAIAQTAPTILNQDMITSAGGLNLDVEGLYGAIHLGIHGPTYTQSDETETTQVAHIIWDILTHKGAAGSDVSFRDVLSQLLTDTGDIRQRWLIGEGPNEWTAHELLDLIQGTDDRNLSEVYDAILGLSAVDLQPVLDAIAAARGTPAADIRQLATELGAIRTINDWSLGSVKTWIEAIDVGEVDLSPVLTAISNLASQLTTATTNIRGDITGVSSSLSSAHTKLDQIIEAIGGISISVDLPPLITPETVPDYGTPVAISEAMQIDAAMAGLLVDVIDRPAGVREYPVGNFAMIFRAGYLAFINPLGYVEQPQYLSFNKGLYMPRTCTEAIGVLVKPNQGQTGTVTPFTLNGA